MNHISSLLNEPRMANAPGPLRRDGLLVAAIAVLVLIELATREAVVWPVLSATLAIVFASTLPWRRLYPAQLIAVVFGANTAVQVYALLLGVDWTGMYTTVLVLLLPYALLRWGSGREVAAGLAFIGACFVTTTALSQPPLGEIVGGGLFILFPSTLGLSVRFQNAAQQRAAQELRLREREQLARELHDTVGHYVSAIAIQAQAGKALASSDAQAPLQALDTIEEAASGALAEMRNILRAMRGEEDAAFTPGVTLADIERLTKDNAYPFRIDLTQSGDLSDLDASTTATLYRLAQESITNVARHGRHVNSVMVAIARGDGGVQLSVTDDGEPVTKQLTPGLGLQGMSERVSLLGGTLTAAPGEQRGWVVSAALPVGGRKGSERRIAAGSGNR